MNINAISDIVLCYMYTSLLIDMYNHSPYIYDGISDRWQKSANRT